MSSNLVLPRPARIEQVSYAGTAVLALLLAGAGLFFVPWALWDSIDAEKAGVWDFVAMGFVLGFPVFLIWVAWSCRIVALPFRFTVDVAARKCGYRWGSWWTGSIDLRDAKMLRGEVFYTSARPYQGAWRWRIYAVRRKFDKGVLIYATSEPFQNEGYAEGDCRGKLQAFSNHLGLPWELAAEPVSDLSRKD